MLLQHMKCYVHNSLFAAPHPEPLDWLLYATASPYTSYQAILVGASGNTAVAANGVMLCSLRIFDLPAEAYTGDAPPSSAAESTASSLPDSFPAALHAQEGELVYDYAWYSRMHTSDPVSCCFATTSRVSLHLNPFAQLVVTKLLTASCLVVSDSMGLWH